MTTVSASRSPRALVVRGGWDGHHPVEATELFIPFLEANGYDVRIDGSPEVYAVTAGTGLAGWHGGIADSFRASSDYLQLVGGQFATHPSKRPELVIGDETDNYLPYTVELTELGRAHEILAGIDDFTLETEQYWVLHDSLIDVLATMTHPVQPYHPWHRPIVSPAVWTRQWGAGRVFVATPGHSLDVLRDPNVRTIIER